MWSKWHIPRCAIFGAALALLPSGMAENRSRTELPFPDLPGYVTLRCDFHLHTVFSDGVVWPTVRAEEAWRDGLDAIAFTDHIEYLPHKGDIPVHHGRSYEIGRATAESLGIIPICAAEITRGEPPGHLNALFLTNVAALDEKDYRVALEKAFGQGAFIFWNHPGWKQPQQKSVWYAEQGEFYEKGWLQGIEIVNGDDYDPIAHRWCLEKRLTIVGNSDAHNPVGLDYAGAPGDIRPMTLVFAKERTREALHEGLRARRTAVFSKGVVYGEPEFLEPLFQASIEILNPEIRIRGKGSALVQIRNRAPLQFVLRLNPKLPELDVSDKLTLPPGKVSLVRVSCASERVTGEQVVPLPCKVLNLIPAPGKALSTQLRVPVKFTPAGWTTKGDVSGLDVPIAYSTLWTWH